MIKQIKIFQYPDGTISRATFDTINQMEGPDFGCRVKHNIYRDSEHSNVFWHERVYLSRSAEYMDATFTEYVSERKFFGKVRLVQYRDACTVETWLAVAQCVSILSK